jgi:putative zinc finger protein
MTGSSHEALVDLLASYADEELAEDSRREVENHLVGCELCRRELRTQVALRARLLAERPTEPRPAVTPRLLAHLRAVTGTPVVAGVRSGNGWSQRLRSLRAPRAMMTWSGWLVAASLALVVYQRPRPVPGGMSMAMGNVKVPPPDVVPEPLAGAALQDFQRLAGSTLPVGTALPSVQADVPFSVPYLRSAHMRLIASWATEFEGERAAVLAYRCHNRLVVQYVVSERAFFRQPRLRHAIASAGLYAAGFGKVNAIAWPDLDSGSFLVGEFTPAELAAMRL